VKKINSTKAWAWGASLALMLAVGGGTALSQGIVYVAPQSQPYYSLGYPGTFDFDIDINGDGTTDFTLRSNDPGTDVNNAFLIPLNGNEIVVGGSYGGFVANMANGEIIGSSLNPVYQWSNSKAPITTLAELLGGGGTIAEDGNFVNQASGYIGFDLVENGNNYYGWMFVTNPVFNDAGIYGMVTEWAYESDPNTPITVGAVPEPSTWALLGLGMASLFCTSKKKKRPSFLKAALRFLQFVFTDAVSRAAGSAEFQNRRQRPR
jgi:hypothetical protein